MASERDGPETDAPPGPVPRPVSFALRLPLPPSVNNQYATVGKRRVLSRDARAFQRDTAKVVERLRAQGVLVPADEAVLKESFLGVYFTFYFETPSRRDLDGGLKIALDALCAALGVDDRAVVDLHLTKRIDPLHPHLDVEIEAITEWSFDRSYVYLGDGGGHRSD